MVILTPFNTASLSNVDCTVNFARETLLGTESRQSSPQPLDPWMGYVWEVEEDDNASEEKGDGTKERKRKREKMISADRMERPIIIVSLHKDISNGRPRPQ